MNNSEVSYKGVERLKKYKTSSEIDANILSSVKFDLNEVIEKGVFIFGAGRLGQQVHHFLSSNNISILGYVDNNPSLNGKTQNGISINLADILTSDSIVYIASEVYLNPIRKQLIKSGIIKNISHLEGCILFKKYQNFPVGMYLQRITEDLIENRANYLKVFSLIEDEESKKVFDNLIHYRLSGDIKYIDEISSAPELEYFDKSVFSLESNEVFYDCGGFNGDSALNFINFSNVTYKSVHIFEPDSGLLKEAKELLKKFQNIFFNEIGVFDKTTTLKFDSTGGLDGKINNEGNIEIKVVALDDYKGDAPTYIKLDIEGVEIEALNGAKNLIKDKKPRLAIASYHYPKHFWEIPLHTLAINNNYTIRVRHYSNYIMGSTYYFIPK